MLLPISAIIVALVTLNFILLKFSSSSVPQKENPIDKAEPIRREIQINVQRRLRKDNSISYLRVV